MEKTWVIKEKRSDKIITLDKYSLNIIKLKPGESYKNSKNEKDFAYKKCHSINLADIQRIQYREGKNYFRITYKNNNFNNLSIKNSKIRSELFNSLKEFIPFSSYKFVEYSPAQSAKLPITAFLMFTFLFLWVSNLALKYEAGYGFEMIGSGTSAVGIIYSIANLGSLNVMLIFFSLLGISYMAMVYKMNRRPKIHEIYCKK